MASPELRLRIAAEIDWTDSIIDLGCGIGRCTREIFNDDRQIIAVDNNAEIMPYYIDRRSIRVHSDALEFISMQRDLSAGVVLVINLLEHMDKDDGVMVLAESARVAKRAVVVFTPVEPKTSHACSWAAQELWDLGYKAVVTDELGPPSIWATWRRYRI